MIVVNLWGAPSSGKSTTAAGLFFLMKINKQKVELVGEYAKELIFDRRDNMFREQNLILAEQEHRLARLNGHALDFVISDSPLPLTAIYNTSDPSPRFTDFVMDHFHSYNNINYFLVRRHSFEKIGRRHNESQSIEIEKRMREFLDTQNVDYQEMEAHPRTPELIWSDLKKRMAGDVSALPFSDNFMKNGS